MNSMERNSMGYPAAPEAAMRGAIVEKPAETAAPAETATEAPRRARKPRKASGGAKTFRVKSADINAVVKAAALMVDLAPGDQSIVRAVVAGNAAQRALFIEMTSGSAD